MFIKKVGSGCCQRWMVAAKSIEDAKEKGEGRKGSVKDPLRSNRVKKGEVAVCWGW